MKKFACVLILSLFVFSAKVFAADVWFATSYDRDGNTYDLYVMTHYIKENFDAMEFTAPVKEVWRDGRGGNPVRPQRFKFMRGEWYAKYRDSSMEFEPVNDNYFYRKLFDALTPYCELAQTYPR